MENEENIIGGPQEGPDGYNDINRDNPNEPQGPDENIGDNLDLSTPQGGSDSLDGNVWDLESLVQDGPEDLDENNDDTSELEDVEPDVLVEAEEEEQPQQIQQAFQPEQEQTSFLDDNSWNLASTASSDEQLTPPQEEANTNEEPQNNWNYDSVSEANPDITAEPIPVKQPNFAFPQNKKLIAVAAGLVVVILLAVVQLFTGNKNTSEENIEQTMQEAQQQMGDDFYKAASGEDVDLAAMQNQNADGTPANPDMALNPNGEPAQTEEFKPSEPLVTINLAANVGRTNPFVPTVNYGSYLVDVPQLPSAINFPPPPTELVVNEPAIKLMETTISGILYDAIAPSAIVKVEGRDHLVRKGDRINGYKILNITKDRVIVQNGTNIYRASVGETIKTESTGSVNFNTVDNLTRKFGGASAPAGTKMIQIN